MQRDMNGLRVRVVNALTLIMKRSAIVIPVLYWLIGVDQARAWSGRFGIECVPALSMTKIYCADTARIGMHHKAPALGMHFGMAYHIPLQLHCSLSMGLSYALGPIGVGYYLGDSASAYQEESYLLRSIWLPILCRLYTSEVQIDTRFYVKLGVLPAISLSKRPILVKLTEESMLAFRRLNCLILLGGGIKYDFSLTNSLAVGLSYCGDLAGIMYASSATCTSIHGHNSLLCLDIGLLF